MHSEGRRFEPDYLHNVLLIMLKICKECDNFTWWDGDYVCILKWMILQESEHGEIDESKLIDEDCVDFIKAKV